MDAENIWIVEWSYTQTALHIETLESLLNKNLDQCFHNKALDYIPIARAASHAEAHEMANEIAKRIPHIWSKQHDTIA